jgi:hypothetical protein
MVVGEKSLLTRGISKQRFAGSAEGVSPMRAKHHLTAILAFVMLMNEEKPPG